MAEAKGMTGHAFISYVHEDTAQAAELQRVLEAVGIPVWRDKDDLWPGQDWRRKIRRAIVRDALVFIVCFSTASLARPLSYQNEELLLAIDQMRLRSPDAGWLIPVRLDACEIPDLDLGAGRTLDSIQCADFFGRQKTEGSARIIAAVLRVLEPASARQTVTRRIGHRSLALTNVLAILGCFLALTGSGTSWFFLDSGTARIFSAISGVAVATAIGQLHFSVRNRQISLMKTLTLCVIAALCISGTLITAWSTRTYTEQEYNKHGATTFRFLNATGPGQPLKFKESVQVTCKIRNTTIETASPDGYWYRIASLPWNNKYYAVANTFLNGDPPNGPYTHNTDFTVPNCPKPHFTRR